MGLACYSCVSVSGSNRECEDPMHGSVHVEAPCRQGQPGHEGLGYARYCVKIKGRRVADGQQIYIRRCSMQKLGGINTHCGQFRLSDELYRGFLTVPKTSEYKYFQKRLQEEIIKKSKASVKDEEIEASKVEYKLSDIELPPEKPQPKIDQNKIKPEAPPALKLEDSAVPVKSEEPAAPPPRKRKSRWDSEQPANPENSSELTHEDVLASAIAAAKAAAQLAASGTAVARQFTGGAVLSDEQIKQIQYQKELQAMHEFILAQQRLKMQEQQLMDSIEGVKYTKAPKVNKDGLVIKYEYDSDEDCEGGTWEHKLRASEMEATREWAEKLTEMGQGKHHIGDFLPPDELDRFMETYHALKEGREPDHSEYKRFKLTCENVGFQMLEKMGWKEGEGLGASGQGIINPVGKGNVHVDGVGLGVERPANLTVNDDEFEAYRKRMMLAYRFRPNPLVSLLIIFVFYVTQPVMSDVQSQTTDSRMPPSTGQYSCLKCKKPILLSPDLENLRNSDLSFILGAEVVGFQFAHATSTLPLFELRPLPPCG
ncbi:unnamed protein product [Mesocestoides corti]|uniref:G-patch domain-containing protein n=1 Tax=Mesocestoides corti TaxID=53468 RepID=A0A3P6HW62_MESCO|nr:unnamed protein product [Mesocestoides corti]